MAEYRKVEGMIGGEPVNVRLNGARWLMVSFAALTSMFSLLGIHASLYQMRKNDDERLKIEKQSLDIQRRQLQVDSVYHAFQMEQMMQQQKNQGR